MKKENQILEKFIKYQELIDEVSKSKFTKLDENLSSFASRIHNKTRNAYVGEALEQLSRIDSSEDFKMKKSNFLLIGLNFYWKLAMPKMKNLPNYEFQWEENTEQFEDFMQRIQSDVDNRNGDYKLVGNLCMFAWRAMRLGMCNTDEESMGYVSQEKLEANEKAIMQNLEYILSCADGLDETFAIVMDTLSLYLNYQTKERFKSVRKAILEFVEGKKINISDWNKGYRIDSTYDRYIEIDKITNVYKILKVTKKDGNTEFINELKNLSKLGAIAKEEDLPVSFFANERVAAFTNCYFFGYRNNVISNGIGKKKTELVTSMCNLYRSIVRENGLIPVNEYLEAAYMIFNPLIVKMSSGEKIYFEFPLISSMPGYESLLEDLSKESLESNYDEESIVILKKILSKLSHYDQYTYGGKYFSLKNISDTCDFNGFSNDVFTVINDVFIANKTGMKLFKDSCFYYLAYRYYDGFSYKVKEQLMQLVDVSKANIDDHVRIKTIDLFKENRFFDFCSEVSSFGVLCKMMHDNEIPESYKDKFLETSYPTRIFSILGDESVAYFILKKAFSLFDTFSISNTLIPLKYDNYFKDVIKGILIFARNPENTSLLKKYPVGDLMLGYNTYLDYILAIYHSPELREIEDVSEEDYKNIVIYSSTHHNKLYNLAFTSNMYIDELFHEIREKHKTEYSEEYGKICNSIENCRYKNEFLSTYIEIENSNLLEQKEELKNKLYDKVVSLAIIENGSYRISAFKFILDLRDLDKINKQEALSILEKIL